jgi:serine/threonine protein kinase
LLDILKVQFNQTNTFLVENQFTKMLFVMKMINIGQESSEERMKPQKEIAPPIYFEQKGFEEPTKAQREEITPEIDIALTLGRECPFLVEYLETFYHDHFLCLVMEYCEVGDLQQELDSGKQYEEQVCYFHLFYFLSYLF